MRWDGGYQIQFNTAFAYGLSLGNMRWDGGYQKQTKTGQFRENVRNF